MRKNNLVFDASIDELHAKKSKVIILSIAVLLAMIIAVTLLLVFISRANKTYIYIALSFVLLLFAIFECYFLFYKLLIYRSYLKLMDKINCHPDSDSGLLIEIGEKNYIRSYLEYRLLSFRLKDGQIIELDVLEDKAKCFSINRKYKLTYHNSTLLAFNEEKTHEI